VVRGDDSPRHPKVNARVRIMQAKPACLQHDKCERGRCHITGKSPPALCVAGWQQTLYSVLWLP